MTLQEQIQWFEQVKGKKIQWVWTNTHSPEHEYFIPKTYTIYKDELYLCGEEKNYDGRGAPIIVQDSGRWGIYGGFKDETEETGYWKLLEPLAFVDKVYSLLNERRKK